MCSKNALWVILVTPTASPQGASDSKRPSAPVPLPDSQGLFPQPGERQACLPLEKSRLGNSSLTVVCMGEWKICRKEIGQKTEDRWSCLWSWHTGNILHFPTTPRKRTIPHCEAWTRTRVLHSEGNCPQASNLLFTTKVVCLSYVATFAIKLGSFFWSRTALFQEIKIHSR